MRQLVKLPDVLLTDDEDAAHLRAADALRVLLHGSAPAQQEGDRSRGVGLGWLALTRSP